MKRRLIISLNEWTVFLAFIALWQQREILLVHVDPIVPMAKGALTRVSNWLVRTERARNLIDIIPELQHIYDGGGEPYLYNIFGKIELWQNTKFGFQEIDDRLPDYAMAYKSTVCQFVRDRYGSILLLNSIFSKSIDNDRFAGLNDCVLGGVKAYNPKVPIPCSAFPTKLLYSLINFFFANALITVTVFWTLKKFRFSNVLGDNPFIMVDYYPHPGIENLINDLALETDPMILMRFQGGGDKEKKFLTRFKVILRTDGFLPLSEMAGAIKIAVLDIFRIYRNLGQVEPQLFFEIGKLPFKRIAYRSIFQRYKPKYFFGRDEYFADHIIRRQELNRIGSISLGNLHGIPHQAYLRATFRYINYDRFYVNGRAICRHYADTWAKNMEVVVAGSYAGTRDDIDFIGRDRPQDIAIFAAIFMGHSRFVEIVRSIAAAFPDRTIWLETKSNYRLRRGDSFINECARGLSNVHHTDEPLFSIFRKVSYVISDPSNAAMEAVQFGLNTFVADISDIHEECIFREFPDMCISSAQQAIDRIRSIEDGSWRYPREKFDDLIAVSGFNFLDIVRHDLGLPSHISPNLA